MGSTPLPKKNFFTFLFFTFCFLKLIKPIYATSDIDVYNYGKFELGSEAFGVGNTQIIGKIQYRNLYLKALKENRDLTPEEIEKRVLVTIRKRLATGVLMLSEILTNVVEKTLFNAYILKDTQTLIILIPENDKILPGENYLCNEAPLLYPNDLEPCPKTDVFSQTLHEDTLIKFEQYLLYANPKCSINFVVLSPSTYYLYTESLKPLNIFKSRLVIGSPTKTNQPAGINKHQGNNIYGFISGDERVENRGLIAFVTHYDTFSLAQKYPGGSKTTNSGVIALLELARVISSMYKVNPGKFDVLFLLTSNGVNDFAGADAFLMSHERTTSRLKLAICLDTVDAKNLFLHTSKIHQTDEFVQFINGMDKYSKLNNSDFKIVTSKIKYFENENLLEHEAFSRKKIVSGTLTNLERPQKLVRRSTIFDVKLNLHQLRANIDIILKSFIDLAYDSSAFDTEQAFQTSQPDPLNNKVEEFSPDKFLSKNPSPTVSYYSLLSLNSWLSKTPRTFGDVKVLNKYFIPQVKDYLSKFINNPKINTFKTQETKLTVYPANEHKAYYFSTRHLIFDLSTVLLTLVYLFSLTAYTVGSISGTFKLMFDFILNYGNRDFFIKRKLSG